jgi:hypothetical protein
MMLCLQAVSNCSKMQARHHELQQELKQARAELANVQFNAGVLAGTSLERSAAAAAQAVAAAGGNPELHKVKLQMSWPLPCCRSRRSSVCLCSWSYSA